MNKLMIALCWAAAILVVAFASKALGLGPTGGLILTMGLIAAYLGTARHRRAACGR